MYNFYLQLEEEKLEKAREQHRFVKNYSMPYLYGGRKLSREEMQGIIESHAFSRRRLEKAHRRVQEFQTLDLGGEG